MSGPLQVEFFFSGPPLSADCGSASRTDYAGFNLNGVEYKVGDCAFLYPEDEGVPPYVGRILACFHDRSGCAADPHCVEVAWFERRAHLEVDPLGSNWEREVVALEETDINPIGCISGKAVVFKAGCYEEAFQMAKSLDGMEWFFCRGVYKQNENCVTPYPELVNGIYPNDGKRNAKRLLTGAVGAAEVVADSEDVKRFRVSDEQPAAPVRRTGKLVSGRTCVECGATQTPQWREGPAGPKTLCNACGVRYVRAQQRANKRAVSAGGSRGGCGPGGRNARSNKAARAEAATARAARAAAAAEEVPQRPLRQAALLAANRTAQYARTGIFPQDPMNLESFDNRSGGHVLQHPHQQSRWQHQNMEAARSAPAAPSAGRRNTDANATTAATAHVSALRPPQTQPATPNSCSFDSSGTGNEGVTVEVLVDVAEGEADCCTAGGVHRGVVTSGGGGFSCAAYPPLLPPHLPLPLLPTYESNCSAVGGGVLVCNMPTSEQTAARVGTAGSSQGGVVMPPNNLAPPQQPASPSGAVHGGLRHMPPGQHSWSRGVACGYHGYGGIMFGVASGRGMAAEEGDESGQHHPDSQTELCSHGYESGGGGGCIEVQYGGSGGGGSTYASSGGDSPGVQVISAPVSPSGPGDETAMYDSTFGGCGSCGSGGGLGDEDQLQLHRVYSGQLGCGLGCELDMDEEYDRLVEGDFGLGPEGDIDGGDLFELHDPCAAMTSCTGDCHSALQDAAEGPDLTPEDLPVVAARAAAFCPDLAPGTEARTLLDAIPSFTSAAAAAAAASMNMGVPLVRTAPTIAVSLPAPAAAAVSVHVARGGAGSLGSCTAAVSPVVGSGEVGPGEVLVPDEAVTQLLSVGRQVDRATTEAMAADAALQAVSQVLEARHEAARRAREAAAANLVRLKDCITHLAGADAASKAVSELTAGPLIDLRDLVGSGLPGVGALDGAELVVAVRS